MVEPVQKLSSNIVAAKISFVLLASFNYFSKIMYVKNHMSSDVVTVMPDTPIMSAWQSIIEHHIRQVPVVENGKLVGILSRTDLLRDMVPTTGSEMEEILNPPASESMTSDPVTVEPDTTIEDAAEIMYKDRIGCLPVVTGDNELIGIITRTDLFDAIVDMIGIGDEDVRMAFDFETFDEFLNKADKLSGDFEVLSTLTFLSGDRKKYKSLFRGRQ